MTKLLGLWPIPALLIWPQTSGIPVKSSSLVALVLEQNSEGGGNSGVFLLGEGETTTQRKKAFPSHEL